MVDLGQLEPPSIHVAIPSENISRSIQDILFGIEEEGIPYKIVQTESNDVVTNAHQAAHSSSLAVGIACSENVAVLHYKYLEEKDYFFKIENYPAAARSVLRVMGNNAARLVKGVPFKNREELEVSF